MGDPGGGEERGGGGGAVERGVPRGARLECGRRAARVREAHRARSKAERHLYTEHTKWLTDSAARLAAVHSHMRRVLAKGEKAPITEVATANMELVNARDAIEAEAKRFNGLAKAAKARHESALLAVGIRPSAARTDT